MIIYRSQPSPTPKGAVMRKVASILVAAVLSLTAAGCGSKSIEQPPPPTHDDQVKALVGDLGRAGLVIDDIEDKAAPGGKRQNAHFEKEAGAKTRKFTKCSGKPKKCNTVTEKISTTAYVAEVTVVVLGNCKAQIERVLDVDSTSYYFDETWLGDKTDSTEVDIDFTSDFSFMPTPASLEIYFSTKTPRSLKDFVFCRGKSTTPSPAGRD